MNAEYPLVSILCAVRNDGRFIRETLESVIMQDYPRWELIVMDGASTDDTFAIVNEFAAGHPNIIVRSEPDKGQWHALDKALSLVKGKYIFLLCGQDGYLRKYWFSRCVETLEEHQDVSLVWGIPFIMSEDGKLVGPHYAYAGFLGDKEYGSRTKPVSAFVAKVDWRRSSALSRLWRLLRKLTWSRFLMLFRSFKKREIPQRKDWFLFWLRTGRTFPESNMCVRKDIYIRLTKRFPEETMTNAALLDFCFNFNAQGYLACGLPLAGSFGRSHAEGQALRQYDDTLMASYYQNITNLRKQTKGRKIEFVDPSGKVVSEQTLSL